MTKMADVERRKDWHSVSSCRRGILKQFESSIIGLFQRMLANQRRSVNSPIQTPTPPSLSAVSPCEVTEGEKKSQKAHELSHIQPILVTKLPQSVQDSHSSPQCTENCSRPLQGESAERYTSLQDEVGSMELFTSPQHVESAERHKNLQDEVGSMEVESMERPQYVESTDCHTSLQDKVRSMERFSSAQEVESLKHQSAEHLQRVESSRHHSSLQHEVRSIEHLVSRQQVRSPENTSLRDKVGSMEQGLQQVESTECLQGEAGSVEHLSNLKRVGSTEHKNLRNDVGAMGHLQPKVGSLSREPPLPTCSPSRVKCTTPSIPRDWLATCTTPRVPTLQQLQQEHGKRCGSGNIVSLQELTASASPSSAARKGKRLRSISLERTPLISSKKSKQTPEEQQTILADTLKAAYSKKAKVNVGVEYKSFLPAKKPEKEKPEARKARLMERVLRKEKEEAHRREKLEEKKRQEMQIKKQRREEKARKVAEKKAALETEKKKMKMTGARKGRLEKKAPLEFQKKTNMTEVVTLNTTFIKDVGTPIQSTAEVVSYTMTPNPLADADEYENYGLDDLCSDASTDDEDCPRKGIPLWAKPEYLDKAIYHQLDALSKKQLDVDNIFPPNQLLKECDLNKIFKFKHRRFIQRTSSACWSSPLIKIKKL